jgi:hypothetical protein
MSPNSRLKTWISLIPDPYKDGRTWFSGAASSIVLDEKEILDAFQAEFSLGAVDALPGTSYIPSLS